MFSAISFALLMAVRPVVMAAGVVRDMAAEQVLEEGWWVTSAPWHGLHLLNSGVMPVTGA